MPVSTARPSSYTSRMSKSDTPRRRFRPVRWLIRWTMRIAMSAIAVALLAILAGAVIDPPITRDQILLLKRDNVVSEDGGVKTMADLDLTRTAIEAVVPSYRIRYRRYGQFAERVAD